MDNSFTRSTRLGLIIIRPAALDIFLPTIALQSHQYQPFGEVCPWTRNLGKLGI